MEAYKLSIATGLRYLSICRIEIELRLSIIPIGTYPPIRQYAQRVLLLTAYVQQ